MNLTTVILAAIPLTSVFACTDSTKSATLSDDFSDLSGQDEKSDAFSYRMKIVGSLDYGQTSASVAYSKRPRYRAFKFGGSAGDVIDVSVRSNDGDAVAWVLDNSFRVLASNDDADDTTTDALIHLTLPANASITHYIVFRDYDLAKSHFTVELTGSQPFDTSCKVDADCVAVSKGGCCPNGSKVAVSVGAEDEYATFAACHEPPHVCPLFVILDKRVAQCNTGTKKCEMVAPEDIRCGGFTLNPHQCADGFHCVFHQVPDVPGNCVAN